MDSSMIDFVYETYSYIYNEKPSFRKSVSWSSLKKDDYDNDYMEYQYAIECIIKKLNISNRLEFDYIFWQDAKRINSLKKDEKKKEIKKLLNNCCGEEVK